MHLYARVWQSRCLITTRYFVTRPVPTAHLYCFGPYLLRYAHGLPDLLIKPVLFRSHKSLQYICGVRQDVSSDRSVDAAAAASSFVAAAVVLEARIQVRAWVRRKCTCRG
jgi:hypothetical protein